MMPDFKEMLETNWSIQFNKFSATLHSWSTRNLPTLRERAEVLNTFGLSRVWYRASILPLPRKWRAKFESEARKFIWKNYLVKNAISLESLCLPKERGGLNVTNIGLKSNSLLLRQGLRIITSRKHCKEHLGFWYGDKLGLDLGFDMSFNHFIRDARGRKRAYKPMYFGTMVSLLLEGKESNRYDLHSIDMVATKSIYFS